MTLHPLYSDEKPPERFTYPFGYEPHPLCQQAATEVQTYIASHKELQDDADRGKMFGVLVCEQQGQLVFLAAYSGLLAGRNDWDYFVPPVFDAQQPDGYFKQEERAISAMRAETDRESRKQRSQKLQRWLFDQYRMLNAEGQSSLLVDIWQGYYRDRVVRKFPLPPGGTGDCCAPKLLQYAYQHGLQPRCMAEFWWGQSPRQEIRHHLQYYPACSGKCKPVLSWMLKGLNVDPDPDTLSHPRKPIAIVYEDDSLLVVDKPSGVLSVPGRNETYSVETVMREHYPDSYVAHRLDMGTSGLLIVAKTLDSYRNLQDQFLHHEVRKRYVAVLEPLAAGQIPCPAKGTIRLPMRPDMTNRPLQMVDMEHGKTAVTNYEFIDSNTVSLTPHTGRTHQLRVHCAHPDGLGRPIQGDELYGHTGPTTSRIHPDDTDRLMLHAAEIWFRHPVTNQPMHFVLPLRHDKLHLI